MESQISKYNYKHPKKFADGHGMILAFRDESHEELLSDNESIFSFTK